MCEEPRSARTSGEPVRALISGAVTSVSRSSGLRGHFAYTTICGSEMSGIASSDASRTEYRLTSTPAAASAKTAARHLTTVLMRLRIIRGSLAGRFAGALQFVLSVDEETAEGNDRRTVGQTVEHLRIQLALNAGVKF